MKMLKFLSPVAVWVGLYVGLTATAGAETISDFWIAKGQPRATATQNLQPHWATPLATSTPRIDQAMRMEFVRQTNSRRYDTWNLGNDKGLELIPERHTELVFGVPPFFTHSQPGV